MSDRNYNPYPDPFTKVCIPNQVVGDWWVQTFTVAEEDVSMMNLRASIDRRPLRILPPGTYTLLGTANGDGKVKGGLVMSDTPSEAWEHMAPIHHLRKLDRKAIKPRILVNGLGLGLLLKSLLTFKTVELIRVIELQPEVIQMVAPRYRCSRVEIVEGNALEYRPDKGERFDMVWHDIWSDHLNSDTISESHALHRRYGRLANWQESWSREYYESDRRMYR